MKEIHLVVAYDITNDKRRNEIAKALKQYGARQQYSFFECIVTAKQLVKMQAKLLSLSKKDEGDRVGIIPLCPRCSKRVQRHGYEIPEFFKGDMII